MVDHRLRFSENTNVSVVRRQECLLDLKQLERCLVLHSCVHTQAGSLALNYYWIWIENEIELLGESISDGVWQPNKHFIWNTVWRLLCLPVLVFDFGRSFLRSWFQSVSLSCLVLVSVSAYLCPFKFGCGFVVQIVFLHFGLVMTVPCLVVVLSSICLWPVLRREFNLLRVNSW